MFQVGDKVAVYYHNYDNPVIDEIARITPTGRIRLKKASVQYNKRGYEMGCRDSFYRSHIVPLTPELEQKVIQGEAIERAAYLCRTIMKKDLDYETAKKLIELLDKKGEV
jgi:hypothetical protein